MSDLGLNLNIWNVDVKTNAIFFTNNIKQDFHSRENRLLKSIKTRLFLYLLNFILHLIEALSSHFAPFSSAICSLFHKISTAAFQLFHPKNTLFEYFFTPSTTPFTHHSRANSALSARKIIHFVLHFISVTLAFSTI